MLFNTYEYFIFLAIVLYMYWKMQGRSVRMQNWLILAASYTFYGWWDWRFLSLIIASSAIDYWVGLKLVDPDVKQRKLVLSLSVLFNLGMLGFFKYFNFFIGSMVDAMGSMGYDVSIPVLQVVLPVGISFYTFQTMSYSLDIYHRKIEPTKDILSFFGFVSFFPQLVAGPIERAANLLPQFQRPRSIAYEDIREGGLRILWGMFKKVFIADNLSVFADRTFANYSSMESTEIILGIMAFSIQIYCDFSGYSDIAIGSARLLGFRLMENFKYPYFAKSIEEFWRRWHVSLSSWFRDYLYIPLGGNRKGEFRKYINLIITFTVSGLWHGANWTFVLWGFLNGLYYIPSRYRNNQNESIIRLKWLNTIIRILVVNVLVLIAWVLFRASTVNEAIGIYTAIIQSEWSIPETGKISLFYIVILFLIESFNQNKSYPLESIKIPAPMRYAIYISMAIMVLSNIQSRSTFIYFQF